MDGDAGGGSGQQWEENRRGLHRALEMERSQPVADFGERIMYAPALSVGTDKFDVGWKEGVWQCG